MWAAVAVASVLGFAPWLLASGGEQALPPAHQDTPVQPGPAQPFRVETNFVRVDVFPTADGRPVLDLTANDFDVLEDGVPQKIESFEHVQINQLVSSSDRRDPSTIAESRVAAANPRARVFVIFLDGYQTPVEGSYRIQHVLANMLDRLIGPDDLFAVMTPRMSASEIVFARRTETIEGELQRYWYWGRGDALVQQDPEDQLIQLCYGDPGAPRNNPGVDAAALIARRHEKLALDALTDLSRHLRGVRDERKAVIAVTSGWQLYQPDNSLLKGPGVLGGSDPPSIGTGPDGRLTTDTTRAYGNISPHQCERIRFDLANIDDHEQFYRMLDIANRANVSFYPIDAAGLRASDHLMDMPQIAGQRILETQLATIRSLAENTDGIVVSDTNNLGAGAQRIVDDLSSYYLLGYYSTNTRPDGKFHKITVRVKRAGIDVRARRGYLAPSMSELAEARAAAATPASTRAPNQIERAIADLSHFRPNAHVLARASLIVDGAASANGRLWMVAEFDPSSANATEWWRGGTADIAVSTPSGVLVTRSTQAFAAGARAISLGPVDGSFQPGRYVAVVRLTPSGNGSPVTVEAEVEAAKDAEGAPLLFRRTRPGPPQYVPTAAPLFRRTDLLRAEVPLAEAADSVEASLLDRRGERMPLPVAARLRTEQGSWADADLDLAPLAPGDYVLKITVKRGASAHDSVVAFRLVPQ
jgi:VWFA-related protein